MCAVLELILIKGFFENIGIRSDIKAVIQPTSDPQAEGFRAEGP